MSRVDHSRLIRARVQVDMMVASGCGAHDHAVWVKRGRRDGRPAILSQERRVRLDAAELLAVEVEDFDDVGGCAAVYQLAPPSGTEKETRPTEGGKEV